MSAKIMTQRVLLFASLLFAFYRLVAGVASVPLHIDEFVYIHHSNWLNELRQGEGSVYQVSGDTLRDPPVTPYLIGLTLRAGGYPDAPAYRLSHTAEGWSLSDAFLPELARLWLIRFPMAALSFLSIALAAALTMRAAGWGAGLLVVFALAGSEYLLMHLRRAMTEAPMLFFLLALMAATAWAQPRLRGESLGRALLSVGALGILAGLGIASKHNAAVNLLPLCALITVAALGSPHRWKARWRRGVALNFVACACALGTFVALTPILHREPLRRMEMMLAERQRLIAYQQQEAGGGLTTIAQRIEASVRRTLHNYMPVNCSPNRGRRIIWDAEQGDYHALPRGTPSPLIDTPLCAPLIGWVTPLALLNTALIALGGWTLWQLRNRIASKTLLIYGAVNLATAVLLIPLDWDRYYLLPVLFATTLMAVGVAQVGHWISLRARVADVARRVCSYKQCPRLRPPH